MDHFCYFCFVFVSFSCLFIAALWSPVGKGLTSWLSCMTFVMFYCVFVTFPCGGLGQVWCLIVSIPDMCLSFTFITRACRLFTKKKTFVFVLRCGSWSPLWFRGRLSREEGAGCFALCCVCLLFRESPPQFENRIMARVYVRSITRCTMYQKDPFCKPKLAYGKLFL